jgi:glutathione S-transferase
MRKKRLSQFSAMPHYLADHLGHFGGRKGFEKPQILRWILFENQKFISYLVTCRWICHFAAPNLHTEVLAFMKLRTDAAFAVVEHHIVHAEFIVGDRPTIADFSLIGYTFYPTEETGYDFPTAHPNIAAWMKHISAPRGWKHSYKLLRDEQVPRHECR